MHHEVEPRTEPLSKDGTPDWAYDEDGYCVCCGNGSWKYHMPDCELRDALDAHERLLYDAYAALRETHLRFGISEDYPDSALKTHEEIGTYLFPDSG